MVFGRSVMFILCPYILHDALYPKYSFPDLRIIALNARNHQKVLN